MNSRAQFALAAVALLIIALAAGALASFTWDKTAAPIARNERAYSLRQLNEILPPSRYDNALFEDTTTALEPELLGSDEPLTVYRARAGGEPVAVIMTVIAPDGYSGPIRLLVGIYADGSLAGVRVAQHRETAGLGDQIEADESDWILAFEGRSLGDPPPEQWKLEINGGVFDKFTGATITPRAVVKAVRNALIYFDAHRDELFARTIAPT